MHYWSDGAASQFNNQYNDLELLNMLLPWDIRTVHYWSDGAASQFNNQYNDLELQELKMLTAVGYKNCALLVRWCSQPV